MIMGANIGTTVTNSIVALAHMGRKEEFRRAFAVATCHDFFNYLTVIVLLPLELLTGYLRRAAVAMAGMFTGLTGAEYDSPIRGAIKAGTVPIKSAIAVIPSSPRVQGVILILVSVVLIFIALMLLVRVMRAAMLDRVESIISRTLGRHAALGILVGIVATVMVQSSSITTSLLVPLGAAGMLTLAQAFPITVGANIGTTVTAFLAALAATGVNAQAGVIIALVHLLFNLTGTAFVFSSDRIRRLPLLMAERLAQVATRSRRWALFYVLILFYGLPAAFAVLNRYLGS